tara:strand:+ start:575 stop:1564 length:990 start_codon:yes stop_codon:yes gene_type:complete
MREKIVGFFSPNQRRNVKVTTPLHTTLSKTSCLYPNLFNTDITSDNVEPGVPVERRLSYEGNEDSDTRGDRAITLHHAIASGLKLMKGKYEEIKYETHPKPDYMFRQTGAMCPVYATFQVLYTSMFPELSPWTQKVLLCLLQDRYPKVRFQMKYEDVLIANPDIMNTYDEKHETAPKEDTPANGSFKRFLCAMLSNCLNYSNKQVYLRDIAEVNLREGGEELDEGYTICTTQVYRLKNAERCWKRANEIITKYKITFPSSIKAFCVFINSNTYPNTFQYPHFVTYIGGRWYDSSEYACQDNPYDSHTELRHYTLPHANVTHVYALVEKT